MSYSNKLKLLLDTTYLLPIVGIEVEDIEKIMIVLKELYDKGKAIYYYTPFNVLEIIAKLSRIKYDERRVYMGLLSIEENFKQILPNYIGYLKALKLKTKGYKDLIDLLLYTTSLTRNIPFLTRDRHLIDFLEEQGEDTHNIIYEEEFESMYPKIL